MPRRIPLKARARRRQNLALEQLKERLLARALAKTEDSALHVQLRRAARDAAALAWSTPCPLLVFPVLFEEKGAEARDYTHRQARLRSGETLAPPLAGDPAHLKHPGLPAFGAAGSPGWPFSPQAGGLISTTGNLGMHMPGAA